jgi:hypothetical protein
MNHFILQLASMKDVVKAPSGADVKTDPFAAAQMLVLDETQRLLSGFLVKERAAAQYSATAEDEALHSRSLALVKELLTAYNNMESEHLKDMLWLSPVLLGSCIQSKNGEIRGLVQKLVQHTSPPPKPYPSPVKPVPPSPTHASETHAEATSSADPPAPLGEGEVGTAVSNGGSVAEKSATETEVHTAEEPESEPVAGESATEMEEEHTAEEPESEESATELEMEEEQTSEESESEPTKQELYEI